MNKGILYAIGTYGLWGILPIFWKALQAVPAAEILPHRMVWSLVLMVIILSAGKHWRWLAPTLKNRVTLVTFFCTATILSLNWFIYIWAVNAGYIVETSLGYFINPLVNVLLGVVFLHERLRRGQWAAIAVAGGGVLYLTLTYGSLPWIALTLAFSFGIYGLLRKTAALNAFEGLSLETGVMFLPALAYLGYLEAAGGGAFGHAGTFITVMLALAGVATALPLILFAAAARRITLSSLGVLQYIAPTLQFLLGVFVYGEPFTRARLAGFSLIWLALALYTVEGVMAGRQKAGARFAN